MILVFGKTGQVATEIQSHIDVFALGREQADLSDLKTCVEAIRRYEPCAVINAAAYTAVDKTKNEENLANTINSNAPSAMPSACAKRDIPLVYISTDYVFDGSETKPWSVGDIPNPQNAYHYSDPKPDVAELTAAYGFGLAKNIRSMMQINVQHSL